MQPDLEPQLYLLPTRRFGEKSHHVFFFVCISGCQYLLRRLVERLYAIIKVKHSVHSGESIILNLTPSSPLHLAQIVANIIFQKSSPDQIPLLLQNHRV